MMRPSPIALVLAGLLIAPSCLAGQATSVRLGPGECRWERVRDVAWGHRVLGFSSDEEGNRKRATGTPDVFPRAGPGEFGAPSGLGSDGSIPNLAVFHAPPARVWSPSRSDNRPEWISLTFRRPILAYELWVFLTGGAAVEMRIAVVNEDLSITPVAELALEQPPGRRLAQVVVPLDTVRTVYGIRVEVDPRPLDQLVYLDAVAAVPRRVCAAAQRP